MVARYEASADVLCGLPYRSVAITLTFVLRLRVSEFCRISTKPILDFRLQNSLRCPRGLLLYSLFHILQLSDGKGGWHNG